MFTTKVNIDILEEDLREWIGVPNRSVCIANYTKQINQAIRDHMDNEFDNIGSNIFEQLKDDIEECRMREAREKGKQRQMPNVWELKRSEAFKKVMFALKELFPSDRYVITTDWGGRSEDATRYFMPRVWDRQGDYNREFASFLYKFTMIDDVIQVVP